MHAQCPGCGQAIRDLPGFRSHSLPRNDDSWQGPVSIFEVNFFGRTYNALYVNNNGNVTFQNGLGTYTPFGLAGPNVPPIIAVFFADVDTTGARSNVVRYGEDRLEGKRAFGVDYFGVGYYSGHDDRLNTFQLILIERSDTGAANFDIEFNYGQIQWDIGGLSDVTAAVGYASGAGDAPAQCTKASSVCELPGSRRKGEHPFLGGGERSLVVNNLNSTVPGRYVFQVRNGTVVNLSQPTTVNPLPTPVNPLRITTPTLPAGTANQHYSVLLNATGGKPPYTWSTVEWPSDLALTLNSSSGTISGTPVRPGEFRITLQVADQAVTEPASRKFTLLVNAAQGPAISPYLIEPAQATVGVPAKLVAVLRGADSGTPATAQDLPPGFTLRAQFTDQSIVLHDEGDGHYSASAVFTSAGDIPVILHATAEHLDRSGQAVVKVWSRLFYSGDPITLDLGHLKAGDESCKTLALPRDQQGDIPLEFRLMQGLPTGHALAMKDSEGSYEPGNGRMMLRPNESKQICLTAGKRSPSSQATGQPWIELMTADANGRHDLVEVRLIWQAQGLTFWQRWGWLFLLLAVLAILALIIYGYIKPRSFPRDLALTFVPDYEDLDESPQPVGQWRGVGIGFYRDAQAFLHSDFRISGNSRGALGKLKATQNGVWLTSVGSSIYREVDLADWEEIPSQGHATRVSVVYRIGERGPFFRISSNAKKSQRA